MEGWRREVQPWGGREGRLRQEYLWSNVRVWEKEKAMGLPTGRRILRGGE